MSVQLVQGLSTVRRVTLCAPRHDRLYSGAHGVSLSQNSGGTSYTSPQFNDVGSPHSADSLNHEIPNLNLSDEAAHIDAELDRILKQLLATLPKESP